jgi:type II restriction enzyme
VVFWAERIKNFRSIRRGIQQVVSEIKAGAFGTAYRGSSLEVVVHTRSLSKDRCSRGAITPSFGNPNCESRTSTRILTTSVHSDECLIPACAATKSRLHPTLAPPFNTAIVNGYNALTGTKVKLARWEQYLVIRKGMLVSPPLDDNPAALSA